MATAQETLVLPKQNKLVGYAKGFWWFAKKKPLGAFGVFMLVLLVSTAVFAQQIATYDPVATSGRDRLQGPSTKHWFGTDDFGRDVFSRIVHGARASMFVGLGAVAFGTGTGVILGITSGYFRGPFDLVLQRFIDAKQATPTLIITIAVLAVIPPTVVNMMFVIGFFFIGGSTRVIRSATLAISENDYIKAAIAIGAGHIRVLSRYILPNVIAPVIIAFSVTVGAAILTEASLSFLGFGIKQPTPSWGTMLNLGARQYMLQQPTLAIFPGLAITLCVFGFNMLGDALRDVLDPRLRGGK